MSSIDPRGGAARAGAEEARRQALERARQVAETTRAIELGRALARALESRKESSAPEVARVLRDAESLGPEARRRFVGEAANRTTRSAGAEGEGPSEAARALRARIEEAFPGASEGRRALGEALASLRGGDPRAQGREALEGLVSESIARLDASATSARAARETATPAADVLERAPDTRLFGAARPVVAVSSQAPVRAVSREVAPASDRSAAAERVEGGSSAREATRGVEIERASARDVALDREDLAAAFGLGRARVIERASSSEALRTESREAAAAETVGVELVRSAATLQTAVSVGKGFFARVREKLVLTAPLTEAVVASGVRSLGGSLEGAATSLARAREALSNSTRENVRVLYGLRQAGGFFDKIAAHLERTGGLVASEIAPSHLETLRAAATAARGEFRQIQLAAGGAGDALGETTGWAKQVRVKAALRDVAELGRGARRAEGELRMLGGRAAVLESLDRPGAAGRLTAGAARLEVPSAQAAAAGAALASPEAGSSEVESSEGTTGIPPHRAGEGGSSPELAAPSAGIPADFSFTEEDLARIGTGLDPSKPPPQSYWSEELVNTLCDLGRQQGGVTDADGHAHSVLAGQLLEGEQRIEMGAADLAVALKAAGIALEKVDPNQLQSAARYVSAAATAGDQRERLRKALDNFQVLATIGAPALTRHQIVEQLWAIARVPGHALEKLSDSELRGKFQEILTAVNSGPGRVELKVGSHNLKFTVGESGQVTGSETKKPGFFSKIGGFFKKIAPIALTVASFIPLTAPFARIAQGAISLVKSIRAKSLLGAVSAAAGMVAGGATALAGKAAEAASSTAAQVARVANGMARGLQGVSSLRQGSVLGGLASIGSGVAEAIGRAAEGAATGLQRFSNRLGDVSTRLSQAARGIGIVDGYRAASRAVDEARVALRQAEASGDAAAIALARQQLDTAEKAKTSALLGSAASAAGLAADVRASYTHLPGAAQQSPIPKTGLDQALRGVSRGLDVAQGIHDRDYAAAGVNALGLAAVGRAVAGQESEKTLRLTDAANMADAALGYHQASRGQAAAEQAVADAERALEAAHRSGDAAAIAQAEASLDRARRSREGALMGAIGAGDSLVLTAAAIGDKLEAIRTTHRVEKEVDRAISIWQETDAKERAWLAQLQDEGASPAEREAALSGIQALRQAKEAYNAALDEAQGDPEKLRAATAAFERLQAAIETEVAQLAARSAPPPTGYAALRQPEKVGVATVERGMTVWEISQRTGVPVERILEFNAERGNSLDPRRLQVGQEILVPLGEDDVRFTPKTAEEVEAMKRRAVEARRAAELQSPEVHSPEIPLTGSGRDVRADALSGLANDRAFLRQDEEDSRFAFLNPSTWVDTKEDEAKNAARDVLRQAIDRLESVAGDPAATDAEVYAALQDKNQALLLFNRTRGVVLDAAVEANFLTPVKELAQEAQDAVHGVTGRMADAIEGSGAPAPLVAAATLPLHIVDSVADLDAGIVKGATDLVDGVAGIVADPWGSAKGAVSLIDRAAQTTLGGRAVEFLGEVAFGKYDSLDAAAEAWMERSDPLKLAQAKWDFTTDMGKAMLSESIEAWNQGKYTEAVGIFLGQSADVVLGAGVIGKGSKAARLGRAVEVLDTAGDAQRVVGAVERTGRVLDTTAEVTRTVDTTADVTRGLRAEGRATTGTTANTGKAAAPADLGVEGTRPAQVADTIPPKSTAPPPVLESKGADVTRPDRVVGSANTPSAVKTSIRPSIAEAEAYKQALRRGEIGLQRPAHANAPGTDFLTAVRDRITRQYRIVVTDVKSSTVGQFPPARAGLSPAWLREIQEAVSPGRLNLGNPAVEAQIRAALAQGRISIRRITVDYSAAGQGAMRGF